MKTENVRCNICGEENTGFVLRSRDKIWLVGGEFDLVKCKGCGLVYVNPRPASEEMRHFYPSHYYERVSGAIDTGGEYERMLSKVFSFRYAPIKKTAKLGKALEIGCADGYFMRYLKKQGWDVYGIDGSSAPIEYAKKNFGLNVENIMFEQFQNAWGAFDMICMFEVFEHFMDPSAVLRKIKTMLNKDGVFVASVPNYGSLSRMLFSEAWHILDVPRHLYQFDKTTLKKILVNNGYEIVHLSSTSRINHLMRVTTYRESVRLMLRKMKMYPSREEIVQEKFMERFAHEKHAHKRRFLKRCLHALEIMFWWPMAFLADHLLMGDNLYVVARVKEN